MKILSIECSAGPASVALIQDEVLLSSQFLNVKTTHSETLMTMVKSTLEFTKTNIDDIDAIAVSVGPGSFTGIRIGISAVKGLAAKNNIPTIPISTLQAIAEPFRDIDCYVCAVMDARCNQLYNAIFKVENNQITRLTPDRAVLCDDLKNELENDFADKKVYIAGDGADLFFGFVNQLDNVTLASPDKKFQNAASVALAARLNYNAKNIVPPSALLPVYLRLPQAERELKRKLNSKEK